MDVPKVPGSTWTQQAKLTADDTSRYDYFGISVSISDDTVIVGTSEGDDSDSHTGSAYIFKRDGSTWTRQAKLIVGDGVAYDYHPMSVSISGDYAIIGTNNEDNIGLYSGSAYIFKRDGSTWTQQAKLIGDDTAPYDNFGISASISGDTAIVGAYGDEDSGGFSGSAYIFKRDGSTWTQQAKIKASDTAIFNGFGWSVSISGDLAIIGTFVEDAVGDPIRSAYLFRREGSTWTELTKITADDAGDYDYFGSSVFISDDTAIIGSPYDDDGGRDSGSAYIFTFSITTANIKADAETIHVGESATLTWNTENADSISIDQGIGTISAEGSLTVSPQETTTYTITATGSHGTSTEKVTVNVIDPSVPPTVNISAAPDTITLGETFILNWNSTNADPV